MIRIMDKEMGLPLDLIAKIKSIFRRYASIETVIVFGSRAKGTFRDDSDVDLTFKGNNLTTNILSNVMTDIGNINSPFLFDISLYDSINSSSLKDLIDSEGKIFYCRH